VSITYPDTTAPINVAPVPAFPVPPGAAMPAKLRRAVDEYEAVRAEHAELLRHLQGSYQRIVDARQRDVAEVRQGRQDGKHVTPSHERDARADQDRAILQAEALRQQAQQVETNVRATAAEVASDYRRALARQTDRAEQAVRANIAALRERFTELAVIARCQQWITMASAPSGPVKHVLPDTSAIEPALEPVVRLLAGPGQVGMDHYLRNMREGDRGELFTIAPGAVKVAPSRRRDDDF
jgi:hypothetical protein